MITVYALAWNEEIMLPYFVAHYRKMFQEVRIVIYDNESTDRTAEIAKELFCEVRTYTTNNTLSDRTYLEIKNSCWKDAQTKWVLIADIDEHVYVTDYDLSQEEKDNVSIIKVHGFNMTGNNGNELLSPFDINTGIRAKSYDKLYCFDRTKVKEINYVYGCHQAHPVGEIKYSRNAYNCRHYKYFNLPYMIKRHATFAKRMSQHNRQHGLGFHYTYSPEEITKEFNEARNKAVVI